jgi:hypothetical protein
VAIVDAPTDDLGPDRPGVPEPQVASHSRAPTSLRQAANRHRSQHLYLE